MKILVGQKRFKNINTVRSYVSRRLREIEEIVKVNPENMEAHRVAFLGARLLGELIQRASLEDRIARLEKANKNTESVPMQQ